MGLRFVFGSSVAAGGNDSVTISSACDSLIPRAESLNSETTQKQIFSSIWNENGCDFAKNLYEF